MRTPLTLAAATLLASLAACTQASPPDTALPTSDAPRAGQGEPQTPNSLPPGDTVTAPIAPRTGDIGTTPVVPLR